MDAKQIALKLVLDGLNEADDIQSVSERVRIQKAIYLAQVMGVNLGYSYSWYVKGPYSTSLTRDYYALQDSADEVDGEIAGKTLHPDLLDKMSNIRHLLAKPVEVALDKWQWYELLASMHFLLVASRYNFERACQVLRDTKPHLSDFLEVGYQHLMRHGLLPSRGILGRA
ncbi:hypothetical protein [Aureimonas sp. AU40]|uniref:hypothetical protein n=1 Tax=Aureimonas sp. AU40 TaxID=1637747 RepID=UPI00178CAB70|nr:hypothetical protein [Aureimonas sp. AU40]